LCFPASLSQDSVEKTTLLISFVVANNSLPACSFTRNYEFTVELLESVQPGALISPNTGLHLRSASVSTGDWGTRKILKRVLGGP
jgi:hypothetical protein